MNTTINELVAIRIRELQAEAATERLARTARKSDHAPVFSFNRRLQVPGIRGHASKPI